MDNFIIKVFCNDLSDVDSVNRFVEDIKNTFNPNLPVDSFTNFG